MRAELMQGGNTYIEPNALISVPSVVISSNLDLTVIKDTEKPKELQETQGEGLGGQEETEGVPGGVLEGEPEDAPGNEPGNSTGVEDGAGEEAQKKDKGKGKEKAL
ncbi:hypothetical protein ID866_12174 [Astraeus odoratus]|nr:hypothetical protein ID866_12174 [Astraeus odoratus]